MSASSLDVPPYLHTHIMNSLSDVCTWMANGITTQTPKPPLLAAHPNSGNDSSMIPDSQAKALGVIPAAIPYPTRRQMSLPPSNG